MRPSAQRTIALVVFAATFAIRCQTLANSSDFNFDTRVDAADLQRWETVFGLDQSAVNSLADADLDGDTDGNDFLMWQREFSDESLLAPEPATIALAVPFVIFLVVRRNRSVNYHRIDQQHATFKPSRRLLVIFAAKRRGLRQNATQGSRRSDSTANAER
ncbi:MAG: hypothetical protein AAGD11_15655 [Planctomycetota bacterium]